MFCVPDLELDSSDEVELMNFCSVQSANWYVLCQIWVFGLAIWFYWNFLLPDEGLGLFRVDLQLVSLCPLYYFVENRLEMEYWSECLERGIMFVSSDSLFLEALLRWLCIRFCTLTCRKLVENMKLAHLFFVNILYIVSESLRAWCFVEWMFYNRIVSLGLFSYIVENVDFCWVWKRWNQKRITKLL